MMAMAPVGNLGAVLCRTAARVALSGGRQQQLPAISGSRREQHNQPSPAGGFKCFSLNHRVLLRLHGRDTGAFLQGLLTHDMDCLLNESRRALYAHVLNIQGRTLFDVILYRLLEGQDGEPNILLECDYTVLESIQKHFKTYKIRRKVSIAPCPDLSLWAVITEEQNEDSASAFLAEELDKDLILTLDPRTPVMGWRLVTDKRAEAQNIVPGSQVGNIRDYHRHRYKRGIPEGVKDIPPGVALPLESNLVYLNGISFNKGCYIGQELTARTHHTGVIRKRLMPVRFTDPVPEEGIPEGSDILTDSGKSAGKYRTSEGDVGLALIRLANASEKLHIKTPGSNDVYLSASVPEWWPKDN